MNTSNEDVAFLYWSVEKEQRINDVVLHLIFSLVKEFSLHSVNWRDDNDNDDDCGGSGYIQVVDNGVEDNSVEHNEYFIYL